jgi:hypothetical protein
LRENFGEPWAFEPSVDARAFQLLGFAETSAGIARTQRENRDGWWEHARRHKAFILDAAARVERPRLAVVLGAGKAYDLPLEELARSFERVVLVDIDAAAMAASSAAAVRDAKLRARLELRPMDVTGVTRRIAHGIEAALASSSPESSLEELCKSYRLASPPRFVDQPADLLVSGMVLSQLGLQPKLTAKRLYEQRFGKIAPEAEARWTASWDDLDRRLQQDHVDALCEDAALAVLSCDVVHRSGGESWSVIGAERLEERVPHRLEVLSKKSWNWARIHGAVSTDVHALLLRRRPG